MPRRLSEELTRKEMIDPQLEKAGWVLRDHAKEQAKVKIEIPVDGYDAEPWTGVTNYRLNYIQHNYNADQIRCLRAVQGVYLQKRHLETADLYEPQLDRFGADAVERWFTSNEIDEIVDFAKRLIV